MNSQKHTPSKLAIRFFRWYCNPDYAEDIEGDLLERFEKRSNKSLTYARCKFILDVLALFRPGIIRSLEGTQKLNYYGMLKHDLLIGWRSLLKNKSYSILNIIGLTIGMTIAILVGLWIHDELSFNKNHKNYDRITQVMRLDGNPGNLQTNSAMPTGLGTLISNDYQNYFKRISMVRARIENRIIANGDIQLSQNGYFMQPEGAEMLSLEMIKGEITGLNDLTTILLSESLAQKLFKGENPMGKVIVMDGSIELKVTGVYKDLPSNSKFKEAKYFAPLDVFLYGWSNLNVWDNYNMYILAELHKGINIDDASSAIKDAMKPHLKEGRNMDLFLSPMSDWHLFSEYENGINVTSERLKFVWFYGLIGNFILLLACINFINLCTANASKRTKEVGVRKSMGAGRAKLTIQFLMEAFILTGFSILLSLVLVSWAIPWFNEITEKEVSVLWSNYYFWIGILSFTAITALLAGSYPAFFLAAFDPINALKGNVKSSKYSGIPRKALVIFQFTISITLIIGTLVVKEQIDFARNRPLGYSQDRLITFQARSPEYKGKYHLLRDNFMKTGVVEEMGTSNYSITSTLGWNDGFNWKGKASDFNPAFNTIYASHEYGNAIGWEFIDGRDFSRDLQTDMAGIIINESAAKLIGIENPVGLILEYENNNSSTNQYTVLGIVKDMVKGSPFQKTHPSIIFPSKEDLRWMFIRIKPGIPIREAITKIESEFLKVVPNEPFDFRFVDQDYDIKFREEEKIANTAGILAGVAIAISCLGLFGLATFVAEQKTKEIGIRKVLGASVAQIWQLLSREFVSLVLIACLISIPISWLGIEKWLAQYDYKTDIAWITFTLAGISALVITLITISFRTIRAANSNPVDSLRDE